MKHEGHRLPERCAHHLARLPSEKADSLLSLLSRNPSPPTRGEMTSLSRFLKSRSSFGRSVYVAVTDALGSGTWVSRAGFSTVGQNVPQKDSVRVQPYCIFKGKAALFVMPVTPTLKKSASGAMIVERHGAVMMTFMPAIGERKYDSEKKQYFALSPTEVGSLISMGSTDSSEFYHDPSLKSNNAGQVRKSLSIKPYGDAGTGYFISLSVANSILRTNERLFVPVTMAEFSVLKTACSFALPHIMGWDHLAPKMPMKMVGGSQKANSRMASLEWDK